MKIKFTALHSDPSNALSSLSENILLIEIDIICVYIFDIRCDGNILYFWASCEIYGMFNNSTIEEVFVYL